MAMTGCCRMMKFSSVGAMKNRRNRLYLVEQKGQEIYQSQREPMMNREAG